MLIDIYMKFCVDSLNGFQVIERTRFCDGQSSTRNSSKLLTDIYMKFHEDSLNSFQVTGRTRV